MSFWRTIALVRIKGALMLGRYVFWALGLCDSCEPQPVFRALCGRARRLFESISRRARGAQRGSTAERFKRAAHRRLTHLLSLYA